MLRLIDCIEAVAFDLDGTLIDTAPDLAAAANSMLRILGGRPLPEHCVAALIGDGVDPFVARVLEESGGASKLDATLQSWAHVLFRNLYEQRSVRSRPRFSRRRADVAGARERCAALVLHHEQGEPVRAAVARSGRVARTLCGHSVRRPSGGSEAESEHAARRVPSAGRGACESAVRRRLSFGYCGGARGELPSRGGHLRLWRSRRACSGAPRRPPRQSDRNHFDRACDRGRTCLH